MSEADRKEKILNVARQIERARVEAEEAREALSRAEQRVRRLMSEFEDLIGPSGRPAQVPEQQSPPHFPEGAARELESMQRSRAAAIVSFLRSRPTEIFTTPQLAGIFKVENVASLRATLNRLVEESKIERLTRGEFRARSDQEVASTPGQPRSE